MTDPTLHQRAIEAVLAAAGHDIDEALKESGIADRYSSDADDIVFDVAILHAWRIFARICQQQGFTTDHYQFAELAADLADEIAADS